MPFCRKCGRRLVEYSESCPDCGTSTTAPIINTKRVQSSHLFRESGPAKIAKAMIPQVSPVQIKVITDKPSRVVVPVKVVSPVKAVAPKPVLAVKAIAPKAVVPAKIAAPVKVAPQAKAVEPPKPFISAKHIVKPKRVTPQKPVAAFTIAFARPVAGSNIAQSNRVFSTKLVTKPKQVVPALPVVKTTPIAPGIQVAPPKAPVQPKPVAPIPSVTPPKPAAQLKPDAPTKTVTPKIVIPAPVYPPHKIIKSNVSLKQDITANPHDYETQAFDFDLKCPNSHFWPAGKALPVSNGIAFCLQCGERLRKPKSKKHRRYRSF